MTQKFQNILGIKFFIGDMKGLLDLCSQGKFIVVPAAPALVDLPTDADYREAMEGSDFAITDSGMMILLWRLFTGQSLPRISGLKLLRGLLDGPEFKRPGASVWIMPTDSEKKVNLAWFKEKGYPIRDEDCYVAPIYPKELVVDPDLLAYIEARQPRYIIINLGGGVQEKIGYYLTKHLSYRPTVLCVGAAIAFITGIQAHIPPWADRWMLGWFFRCAAAPRKFIPRYWKALRLVPVLFKYRERSTAD